MSFRYADDWTLPSTPAEVFRALIEPGQLMRWLAQGAQVEPRVGGVYRFWGRHTLGTPPEDAARQVITRYEPDVALAFEWPILEVDTDVTLKLEAAPEGTRLSLTHNVSRDFNLPHPRELIAEYWGVAIGNLTSHLRGGVVELPDYFGAPRQ